MIITVIYFTSKNNYRPGSEFCEVSTYVHMCTLATAIINFLYHYSSTRLRCNIGSTILKGRISIEIFQFFFLNCRFQKIANYLL